MVFSAFRCNTVPTSIKTVAVATSVWKMLTEVNPFQIDAFRERGRLRLDLGDKAGAEQDMQTVLELDPQQMADVSGEYSAEGIEQRVKQAYSAVNPLGL